MKYIFFPSLIIIALTFSNVQAANLLKQETDSSGMTYYTFQCNNGSISEANRAKGSYTFSSLRNGSARTFTSLSAAMAYACGE